VGCKKPKTADERKESLLAMRLSKHRKSIPKGALAEFENPRGHAINTKVEKLLDEVRELGHYPHETRSQTHESGLAMRLRRARAAGILQPSQEAELQALRREQEAAQTEAASENRRRKACDVMDAVRALGRLPRRIAAATSDKAKRENVLRRELHTVLRENTLAASELAELDEFRWIGQRQTEWKRIEAASTQQTKTMRKKDLRSRLNSSQCRCSCYHFDQWKDFWCKDRDSATRLRDQGFHLATVCHLLGEGAEGHSGSQMLVDMLRGKLELLDDDLDRELKLEFDKAVGDVAGKSCNDIVRAFSCDVPFDLGSQIGLTEDDGLVRPADSLLYLVAPRFCQRPARDVMSSREYTWLLRSYGFRHDWQFRHRCAYTRAWRLTAQDLLNEWSVVGKVAAQHLESASAIASLVDAVRCLGELTLVQRTWLQMQGARVMNVFEPGSRQYFSSWSPARSRSDDGCWPDGGRLSLTPHTAAERLEKRLERLLLAALRIHGAPCRLDVSGSVAEFHRKVPEWRRQSKFVIAAEKDRMRSVASTLLALEHGLRGFHSQLLPGEMVHHLYAPPDLIGFFPQPMAWNSFWHACFHAGITRFLHPFCREHLGLWKRARATLHEGLAARCFWPSQVEELFTHDPQQPLMQGSGASQPTGDFEDFPLQRCTHAPSKEHLLDRVHVYLRNSGLQETGIPAPMIFKPHKQKDAQIPRRRQNAICRFFESMPFASRPLARNGDALERQLGVHRDVHGRLSSCRTDLVKIFASIREDLQSYGLPSDRIGLKACLDAFRQERSPDDGLRMLLEDRPAEAARATTIATWDAIESYRTFCFRNHRSTLWSGAFQPAVANDVLQAAEVRAMHCNDLDLDQPSSRTDLTILRSARLCSQLAQDGYSHPAVQNPHSSQQLCWLCRELGRSRMLAESSSLTGVPRSLSQCVQSWLQTHAPSQAAVGPSWPVLKPDAFHPRNNACKCGGSGNVHFYRCTACGLKEDKELRTTCIFQRQAQRIEYDVATGRIGSGIGERALATHFTKCLQESLEKRLAKCPLHMQFPERQTRLRDLEWLRALSQAAAAKADGQWTKTSCLEGRCTGRCERDTGLLCVEDFDADSDPEATRRYREDCLPQLVFG